MFRTTHGLSTAGAVIALSLISGTAALVAQEPTPAERTTSDAQHDNLSLTESIARDSALSTTQVQTVVASLGTNIGTILRDGGSVELDDFGVFYAERISIPARKRIGFKASKSLVEAIAEARSSRQQPASAMSATTEPEAANEDWSARPIDASLVTLIVADTGRNESQIQTALASLLTNVEQALLQMSEVQVDGLGHFEVRRKPAASSRSPRTPSGKGGVPRGQWDIRFQGDKRVEEIVNTAVDISPGGAEPDAETALPVLEEWVIAQIAAGETADLKARFRNRQEDRVLGATFLEALLTGSLDDAEVHRHGVRIENAVIEQPFYLESALVPYEVRLVNCVFIHTVSFANTSFGSHLNLSESKFGEEVDFRNVRVGGHAFLADVVFEDGANFSYAEIAGNFEAQGAHFGGPKNSTPLMHAPAPSASALFADMRVGGGFLLHGASFGITADFRHLEVRGNLEAQGTDFQQGATFNSLKVDGAAMFDGATFWHRVDFSYADIEGSFQAEAAKFKALSEEANFARIKVGDTMILRETNFAGPVSMEGAHFVKLSLGDVFSLVPTDQVLQLDRMTFDQVEADDPEGLQAALLKLASRAKYHPSVYWSIESFLRQQGDSQGADQAHVDHKRRERRENLHGVDWLWSLWLDVLVRHGRSPGRAFVWSALFIAAGGLVFRREDGMQRTESGSGHYDGIWYSLDLFLPFVDLQAAKAWTPRTDRTTARHYMRIHTLMGWILIPFGLAALAGIIE